MPIFIPPQPLAQTSNISSFNPTTFDIVKTALRRVGAYASTDQPRPEQIEDALLALNIMLKAWQVEGFLWLQEFVTINLVQGQAYYKIGPNSGDIVLDENGVSYKQRPTRIFHCARRNTQGYDVQMSPLSRTDYSQLTNKTTQGNPTQYFYDSQLGEGKLYVWPTANASTDKLFLTVDRNLQDMVSDINTFDLPKEWLALVTAGLSAFIAPEYGLNVSERTLLDNEYLALKNQLDNYNREYASTLLQVGTY